MPGGGGVGKNLNTFCVLVIASEDDQMLVLLFEMGYISLGLGNSEKKPNQ